MSVAEMSTLLGGPHIVIGVHGGKVVAAFFHLTRAAADRRAERLSVEFSRSPKVTIKIYSLPELLRCYHLAEQRELEELERIAKL